MNNERIAATQTAKIHSVDALQLTKALHATLDIEEILSAFSRHLVEIVKFDSFSYFNGTTGNHFHRGEINQNQFNFNLSVDNHDLGEVTVTRHQHFHDEEITVLEDQLCYLVNPLKNAVSHFEALHAAIHDPLTSLLNRSSLDSTLQREIKLAERRQKPLSLMLVDIDNFKDINDHQGHLFGDEVLKAIARIIKETVRETDVAFRFGGEEFLILLSDTSQSGAQRLAERIRQKVEQTQLESTIKPIFFTISIGLACYQHQETQQSLIERADKAMYNAKCAGKNRVQMANE